MKKFEDVIGLQSITAIFTAASDMILNTYDEVCSWFKEEEVTETTKTRKSVDTTKFTRQMAEYIRHYHRVTEGTGLEHTQELNKILGLDKSRASYTRIWSKNFDTTTLQEGEEI